MKILIADSHEFVRRSLKQILVEEYPAATIGEAEDGDVLITKAITGNWDIVISDMSMPGMNSLEALRRIKSHSPRLPVLILSYYSDKQYVASAMKAGASGYLSKEKALDQLTDAIRQVLSGGNYLPDVPATETGPGL